jgi:murein DD-endopeptidase MepM/ murein hydrolase activator NlpD
LREVTILDDSSGRVLASYDAQTLITMLARPGSPDLPDKRVLAGGARAVAFFDVTLTDAVRHRLKFDDDRLEGAVTRVSRDSHIAAPLHGDRWLAMHGLSNASTHRRTIIIINGKATIAQRFATDWTRIGPNGLAFHDEPSKLANWYAYGAPVLAVADGRVVETRDDIPENDPTADKKAVEITVDTAGGNYVLIDIGRHRSAFYAHLQPHSIKVKVGNRVHTGETLALLGNSGNSYAPHLHMHLVDAPSPLAAEGIPYELREFEVLGSVTSLRAVAEGAGWHITHPPEMRHHELPTENVVVTFH